MRERSSKSPELQRRSMAGVQEFPFDCAELYTLRQMNWPDDLKHANVLGPLIAAVSACLGWFSYWKNIRLARKNANRSIYVDGQKFLIEICKQLISEPMLWCIYDDDKLRADRNIFDPDDPKQAAQLRAFAHLHLNMFEIVVNEIPKRSFWGRNASNVWYDYLDDTFSRCSMIRKILDEPASKLIWSDSLHREYEKWQDKHRIKVRKPAKSMTPEAKQ